MPEQIVTGGGAAALLLSLVYVGRLVLDWYKDRKRGPVEVHTAQVGDAATANAVLVQTVTSLQSENARLVERVKHLEAEDRRKDDKITELERQLARIAAELAALRSDHKEDA